MRDLHMVAIVLHAACAAGAFVIGTVFIFQGVTLRQLQLARAVLVLLVLMEVFLVVAILSHVSSLSTIMQVVFGGLTMLGLYMIWRAIQALSVLRELNGDQLVVINHIGFILISLFDAFAIVSAIDVHAPGWLIAVIAVAAVVLGISAINGRKKMLSKSIVSTE
jgi:hypothetical protein